MEGVGRSEMAMRSTILVNVIYLVIAYCSADIFLFKTLKPKLYPFLPAFTGSDDVSTVDETLREKVDREERLDPKLWPWMVVVLAARYNFTIKSTTFETLCFGILITRSDVLTTCGCVRNDEFDRNKMNLAVKPKTTIVRWDPMLSEVSHILCHDDTVRCNGIRSYNNVALLTVGLIQIIYGVIETLPRGFYIDRKTTRIFRNSFYKNCYIVVADKDCPSETESRLVPLAMSKRSFTPWDFHSPENDLGTKIIVGRSKVNLAHIGQRYPGAPLICEDKHKQTLPVGIYTGLFCSQSDFKIDDLNANCSRKLKSCEDCFPRITSQVEYSKESCLDNAFETVLRFDNFEDWLEEDTFEIIDRLVFVPRRKSSSLQRTPRFLNIATFISILLLEQFLNCTIRNHCSLMK